MPELKSRRIPKPIWFGIAAVFMVVLAAFLSVWLPHQKEQVAVREIERFGGFVKTTWDGPKWLQRIVNKNRLSWFDRIEVVYYHDTEINGEAINLLSGLTNLSRLEIADTQINGGLKHLRDLVNLTELYLNGTTINDEVIGHVSEMTNLEQLFLYHTQITDEGMADISSLKALWRLDLFNTQVGDEGFKHVSNLTNLARLNLVDSQVSDDGLIHLYGLSSLGSVNVVENTQVTQMGRIELRKALPNSLVY